MRGRKRENPNCVIEGCARLARGGDLCGAHYHRLRRHGHPLLGNAEHGQPIKWLRQHTEFSGAECLIWPFARLDSGYPVVRSQGRQHVASRLMCELVNGSPPAAWYQAAHSCGNGHLACVNPKHLRWATPSENGKEKRTTHNAMSKLTEDQVRVIRAMTGRATQTSLAKTYGVTQTVISRIQSGQAWSWVSTEG